MSFFKKELFIFLSVVVLFFPLGVLAHGNQHAFQKVDQDKVIVANFNAEKIQSGLPITFNFTLFQIDSQPVVFDLVGVQFFEESRLIKKSVTDKNLQANVETTFTFPKKGNYVMKVVYLTKGKELAKAEFPIAVEQGLEFSLIEKIVNDWVYLSLSILFFIFGGYFAGMIKLHKKIYLLFKNKKNVYDYSFKLFQAIRIKRL